ncbi:Cytochrome P461 monooxygenase [Paramyrothecium foliicola]|nr:Cytochrome P461 monooxygenase [Paramyrothecium foliicola]
MMRVFEDLWGQLPSLIFRWRVETLLGAITAYVVSRFFYLTYFHPASKFPGPRLAAVSNLWLSYHRFMGRHPWAIEKALEHYGDIVRIAPNEIVFITPQAESDIYTSNTKNLEHFTKVESGIPLPDDGISFERDPVKHKLLAKKLSGAWSAKSLNTLEPIIHSYIDLFVKKLKEEGSREGGIELQTWTDRLAMDMSAELAYGRKMHQLQNKENSPLLETFWQLNLFITINRIGIKFPLLSPLKWSFMPFNVLLSHFKIERLNREAVEGRVRSRHEPHPLDHFDKMLPAEAPNPIGRNKVHLEILAGHLLVGGFESVSSQYHCAIMFLLLQPELLSHLVEEVRTIFKHYEDISSESLASLSYLNAVLNETLRLTVNVAAIIPRQSPGANVDGKYISKGIVVNFAHFAFTRSPRYFHDGRSFRPQRWLPRSHPLYDPVFKNDATDSFFPFGRGPRSCIAMAQGWRQLRLYLAKVVWALDIDLVPGQNLDFERDYRLYAMWEKPELWLKRLDYVGNGLLMASTIAMLYSLTYAGLESSWSNWKTLAPLCLGVFGLVLFALWESRGFSPEPVMPPRLFRHRTSKIIAINTFLHWMLAYWGMYFLPLYCQVVLLFSARRTGVALLPMTILSIPSCAIAAALVSYWGRFKWLLTAGEVIFTLGLGLLSMQWEGSSTAEWASFQCICAIGAGIVLEILLPGFQAPVGEEDQAAATSTWAFIRTVGGIWGVAVPATILNNRIKALAYKVSDPTARELLRAGGAYQHASAKFVESFPEPAPIMEATPTLPLIPATQTAVIQDMNGKPTVSTGVGVPELQPGMVLVKTQGLALMPADYKMGLAFPTPGAIIGMDFVGRVEKQGTEKRFQEGEIVCGAIPGSNPDTPWNGAFAEYVLAPADLLCHVPVHMSLTDVVATGTPFLTCSMALWGSLRLVGNPSCPVAPQDSKIVLVYGGSSTCGTMAIQLLKLSGHQPIATCSPKNFDLVMSYGANNTFDYSAPDIGRTIRKQTNGKLRHALDFKHSLEYIEHPQHLQSQDPQMELL